MAGVGVDDPAMVRARERVRAMGGPVKANVFTKILLALFGEYDWNGVPTMPVEIMLLPRPFFLFNIYEVSYWSRRSSCRCSSSWTASPSRGSRPRSPSTSCGRSPASGEPALPAWPEPFTWRGLFWKNFFIGVDDGLKIWERFSPRPLRRRAVDAARQWLEERLGVPGGSAASSRPW